MRPILLLSVSVPGSLFAIALMASVTGAQESLDEARKGLTGEQLFRHEWKPNDPTPVKIAASMSAARESGMSAARESARERMGVSDDGLGPLHNATSCAQCHVDGGASGVEHNVTRITVDPRSVAISDMEQGGKDLLEVFPGLLGPQGTLAFSTVMHDRSTRPGYSRIRDRLATYVPGGIADRWFHPERRTIAAIAKQPVVAGRHGTVDFYLSQRNSPALYGLAAIESVNPIRIRGLAKRQARETDGRITGRFVGKFGWRGQFPSLAQVVSEACAAELGLNQAVAAAQRASDRRSSANQMPGMVIASQAGDPADFRYINVGSDITPTEVAKLTSFVVSIPRPIEKPQHGRSFDEVRKGEKLFGSIGCATCHVPDLHPTSGMFSDLLLHDMGPKLQSPFPAPLGNADTVRTISAPTFAVKGPSTPTSQRSYGSGDPDAPLPRPHPLPTLKQPTFPRSDTPQWNSFSWDALEREWRTPPLWGVADTGPYLHDGRAETLEEAIRWHGGEADSSRAGFVSLSPQEQDLVLEFLLSLRAPKTAAADAE